MANPKQKVVGVNTNADPLTGAPGAHPVGTGVGAAGGGAAGAAAGSLVGGPIGALAGAAVGAVVGGLAGKGVAEVMDPTAELAYWREAYTGRPYYNPELDFEDYEPAYRYGWESRDRMDDRDWNAAEDHLKRDWKKSSGNSKLDWEQAKHAVRDAWHRESGDTTKNPQHRSS